MTQKNKYRFATKLESEEEYKKIADDLIEFAQAKTVLDINAFPLGLMINPKDFAAFSGHSAYFANAYDAAMRLIGARIKQLMYQGAIDRHFALEMLPLYDPEYRQYLIMKKKGDETPPGQTKFITIGMPEYHFVPESEWVRYFIGRDNQKIEGEKRLRLVSTLLNSRLSEEERSELEALSEKIIARRDAQKKLDRDS